MYTPENEHVPKKRGHFKRKWIIVQPACFRRHVSFVFSSGSNICTCSEIVNVTGKWPCRGWKPLRVAVGQFPSQRRWVGVGFFCLKSSTGEVVSASVLFAVNKQILNSSTDKFMQIYCFILVNPKGEVLAHNIFDSTCACGKSCKQKGQISSHLSISSLLLVLD